MKKLLVVGVSLLTISALQAQDTTPGFWERTKEAFRRGVEKVTPEEHGSADSGTITSGSYGTYEPTHVAYGAPTTERAEKAVEHGWEKTKEWTREAWEKTKEAFRNLAQRTREAFGARGERHTTPVATPVPTQRPTDAR